jgi:F420-non-reducing hydrogenase iron-sulfur subunit
VGFLCNWCSYAGADLAGVSRFQYPPNLRVIRVMCSGRVDPVIVLEMFANGADGVIVTGCHPGDCHYVAGNLYEERKIKMLKKLLALTGLELDRLRLEWVSAAEGQRFAQVVTEFTEQIEKLGPSPVSGDKPNQQILDIEKMGVYSADRVITVSHMMKNQLVDKFETLLSHWCPCVYDRAHSIEKAAPAYADKRGALSPFLPTIKSRHSHQEPL